MSGLLSLSQERGSWGEWRKGISLRQQAPCDVSTSIVYSALFTVEDVQMYDKPMISLDQA